MKSTAQITHKDKILFPEGKISKEEVVNYYRRVAKLMLPLLRDRPISMHRFPRGINNTGFFQKRAPESMPEWMQTAQVKRKNKEPFPMILCQKQACLLWLANQNCITPHIWLSKIDKPNVPDRMIFDLDPPTKKEFPICVEGALILKDLIEQKAKLKAFVMTTGSKGLHVVVPIERKYSFEQVRTIARLMAEQVVKQYPQKFTLTSSKRLRKGLVYIDVLRNGSAQTTVAPYAIRALPNAPVAVPLFWKELEDKKLHSDSYTIHTIDARVQKNPWKGIERGAKAMPNAKALSNALKRSNFVLY
jgi:bifunctional non-homologous end joining protein LigD